jgi:outer membrane protein OmpA-like peptidoglycan-associated protein
VHFKIVSDLECLGFSCAWEKPDVLDVLRVTMVDDKVRFGIGTDVIKPAGMKRLSSLAEILIRFPKSTLTVYGYSDSKGTAEEKKDISQRRADRVARVLKEKGVSAERFLSVEGRSDSQPIVKNAGKKGRGTNRRVEVQVHF